jgi:hypothetical protein
MVYRILYADLQEFISIMYNYISNGYWMKKNNKWNYPKKQ